MRLEEVKSSRSEHKMTEATVQMLVKIEMVKRVDKVCPVKVRIDTEHLSEDSLTHINKLLWEATTLANPVTGACKQ